jgi:hypothetical protein
MRIIFTLIFFASIINASYSQTQCDSFIHVNTDKFTKEKSLSINEIITINKGDEYLAIAAHRSNKMKDIYLSVGVISKKITCVDAHDEMILLMSDDELITIKNSSDFNCKGTMYYMLKGYLGKTKKIITSLREKTIKSVRIRSRSGVFETDVENETAEVLRQTINCLFDYKI